jgi:ABC-type glutathione transport system ATPase component
VPALLGENGAGKSTLVKIVAGDYQADDGTLDYDGEVHKVVTPRQARDLGVAIIFQEFQDAATLTVAENISLGRLPNRRGFVDWRAVNQRARRILDQLQVDIDPDASARSSRSPARSPAPPGCSSSTSRRPRCRITRPRSCSASSAGSRTRAWRSSTSRTASTRSR